MWRWLNRILGGAEWRLSLLQTLFGAGGILSGGVVMSWATWATATLQPYAPAIYVAAGLLGALTVSLAMAAYGWFRYRLAAAELIVARTEPSNTVNPLNDTFEKKRIDLRDFLHPVEFPIYKNKKFVDSELIGPAIVVFQENVYINPFIGSDCDLVMYSPPKLIYNAIAFSNTTFVGYRFIKVTFYIDPIMRAKMENESGKKLPFLN